MSTKTNIFRILTALLVLFTGTCLAQDEDVTGFIVVNDPGDTFVNLRSEASTTSALLQKLKNGPVGYCYEKKGKWLMFEYMQGDSLVSGFVHGSVAKQLSDFETLNISGTANKVSFTGRDITVTLSRKAFDKSEHKFGYYDTNSVPKPIKTIDGYKAWGTDGEVPRYSYDKIEVTIGSQTFTLPQEALAGLYEPQLYQFTNVYYDRANDTLYITADNGDGAGGYMVAFTIENKKYRERVIAVPY